MLRWVAGAALMLGAAQARAADVQVGVDNVADATGSVRVDVCAANQWLTTDCTLKGAAPARPGTTVVTVHDVPPGTWAIVAYHDRNNVRHVEQSWLGIPKAGVGFSRNPPLGLKGPSFAAAAVQIGAGGAQVPIHMRFE